MRWEEMSDVRINPHLAVGVYAPSGTRMGGNQVFQLSLKRLMDGPSVSRGGAIRMSHQTGLIVRCFSTPATLAIISKA
ncbi:Uncharacterised protein [Raoultella planticola]|nr:Uncharacterised protein [Raoultella planticola]